MDEYSTTPVQMHVSPAASLAGLGLYFRKIDLFDPVRQTVKIPQKMVKYAPIDKLYTTLITILAGAQGLVQVNTLLRSDCALQRAFGLTGCAEQSVVQQTLDACTAETVTQMYQALDIIFRQHSQAYHHDYARQWQILDVDMTGLTCGPKAALATKGYFGEQHGHRGRQLGRVVASLYQEVVRDEVWSGKTQLPQVLQPMMEAVEGTLELDEAKRQRTILRIDSAGGSVGDINWALERGYRIHTKDYSGERVQHLAQSVTTWVDDPLVRGRQVGWVEAPPTIYVRPVRRIAARCRKKNGQWGIGVIVSALTPEEVLALVTLPEAVRLRADAALLAYVAFYDLRGGTVEIVIKDDKQGLGLGKRSKKSFTAQQMVVLLTTLAHNAVLWARRALAQSVTKLHQYGVKRLVRDLFRIKGRISWDVHGRIRHVLLDEHGAHAKEMAAALAQLLASEQVDVNLGET